MRISSNTLFLLIVLLAVLNGFGLYLLLQYKGKLKNKTIEARIANQKLLKTIDEKDYYLKNLSIQIQAGFKLSENISITDLQQNTIKLQELANKEPLLIFRLKDLDCTVCIDSLVVFLKKYTSETQSFKIAHLVSYENPRDLMVFSRIHNLKENIYFSHDFELALDHFETPYMFILDESMTVLYPIIPQHDRLDFLKHYFELIRNFKHK